MPRLILSSVRGARSAQYLMVSHVAGVSGYSSPKVKGPFGSQQFSACKFGATDRRIANTVGKRRGINNIAAHRREAQVRNGKRLLLFAISPFLSPTKSKQSQCHRL